MLPSVLPSRAVAAPAIVKPLPDTDFIVHGTNAETRWEALRGTGSLTPVSKFFVRNHTSTPLLDATSWRLEIHGSGVARPLSLSLRDLRALPSCSVEAVIECAGNGRSFFTTQQGQTVSGTPWKLGAVGNARWRGVSLGLLLRLAGLRRSAVDVLPRGPGRGVRHRRREPGPGAAPAAGREGPGRRAGRVRDERRAAAARPRVPGAAGGAGLGRDRAHQVAGSLEVSASALYSPWNTQFYRLLGPTIRPTGRW